MNRLPCLIVILAVIAAVLLFGAAGAQQKSTKKSTKQKTTQTQQKANADSLARWRADSVQAAVKAHEAVEARRRADSLAVAKRRADSLAAHPLRVIKNIAFNVGERLVFDVNYGVITAGEAVMSVPAYDSVSGRKCFRIQFTVNSLSSFSWIYKVEDRYLTFIDVEAIAPLRFEQHIREGSFSKDFVAEFDHRKKIATTPKGQYPIPEYVHDILSAFYYVRTLDLSSVKAGDMLTMFNFYNDTSYELGVKILGRQELEVEAGTFRTIVVEPLVREGGLFKSDGRIVIWLTDDAAKMPVRVNTKVVIGSIDTELREYSGLMTPVSARIR
jgi:hypothetical protein